MASTYPERINVLRIWRETILLALKNAGPYSTALSKPTAYLVIILLVNLVFVNQESVLSVWAVWIAYKLAFVVFAITCHRLVLLGIPKNPFQTSFSARELRFVGCLIAVFAIAFFVVTVLLMPFNFLMEILLAFELLTPDNFAHYQDNLKLYLLIIFAILATYISARLCLVFPSTAIDQNCSLKESWTSTRGNGWRIALTLVLFPVLFTTIQLLVLPENAAPVRQTFITMFFCFCLAMEAFALSLIYRTIFDKRENLAVNT